MTESIIYIVLGMAAGLVATWLFRVRPLQAELELKVSAVTAADAEDLLRQEIAALQNELEEAQHALESQRRESSQEHRDLEQSGQLERQSLTSQHRDVTGKTLDSCGTLGEEIGSLLTLVKTFERWHTDMNILVAHNREMHNKNDEFANIV